MTPDSDEHEVSNIYEQAELAMCDSVNTVILTVLRRQGHDVVMQEFHDTPTEGLPRGDAAVLYIDPAQGEPFSYMEVAGLAGRDPEDAGVVALNEKWFEVYVRLVQAAAARPEADHQDWFAIVPWEAPAPASKADVRRRLRP
jgi:hypothetical protein